MSDWVNRILKVATDASKGQKEAESLAGLKDKKETTEADKPKVEKLKTDKIQTKNLSNSISKNSTVKESKTFILTERQVKLLQEAYDPKTFSLEELEKLCRYDIQHPTEDKAYNYCLTYPHDLSTWDS